jgi:pimeloyl-ACP methyl ester carboxylesterase
MGSYKSLRAPPYLATNKSKSSPTIAPIRFADSAFGAFEGGTAYSKLAQSILTCHYAYTQGTGRKNADGEMGLQILEKVDAFRHIPCIGIHGRHDIVCPISTAYDLHQMWPEMELQVVPGAGHSQYDPRITHSLVTATHRMASIVNSGSK